jgi:hypothetical protein
MDVMRVIAVYEKDGEKLLHEYPINKDISVDRLKEIITTRDNDPEIYQIYPLSMSEWMAFSVFMPEIKELDLAKVELFYECFA